MLKFNCKPAIKDDVLKDYRKVIIPQSFKNKKHRATVKKATVKKKTSYITIPLSFDIETTTVDKHSFMYIATFCVDTKYIIYCRTWDEVKLFISYIQEVFETDEKNILICAVHNFAYEWQFIRKLFEWNSVFALSKRKVIKAVTHGIEFRCTYVLSGYSLKNLAKNYTTTQKMVGELDYSVHRNSHTPLTTQEYKYVDNDVIILCEYLTYLYEQFGEKIPLTKTSIVRNEVKQQFKLCDSEYKKNYRKFINNAYFNEEEYILFMQYLYKGGFTHANVVYVDNVLYDMKSFDFKSSYPSCCFEKMPMKFIELKDIDFIKAIDTCFNKDFSFIIQVKFSKVTSKTTHHIYSKHKCMSINKGIYDNGRIVTADVMEVLLNELDYIDFNNFYNHENMEIIRMWYARKDYMPKFMLDVVYECFNKKETLPKDTVEYLNAKTNLNSIYGMCVTSLYEESYEYIDNEMVEVSNNKTFFQLTASQLLLPQWGIWISAYARHNLLTLIHNIGIDCVYSDTDSIKLLDYDSHINVISTYNNSILERNAKIKEMFGYDLRKLGIFDDEGVITKFKTLGCKRYIYNDDKGFHSTVAGLPKSTYKQYCDNHNLEYYATFHNNLDISDKETNKTTSSYTDNYYEEVITDSHGSTEVMHEESGVALINIPFSLNMEKEFMIYLAEYINVFAERNKMIKGVRT